MTVLDQKAAQLPLPERLLKIRRRIRQQMPRALLLGRIGSATCVLLSMGMLYGIYFLFQSIIRNNPSAANMRIATLVLCVQALLGVVFLISSLSVLLIMHRLYPYYYCQMLKGIHDSDFALLLAGEDIQREMDSSWRERFLGMPLRGKLLSLEQHLQSSAMFFDAIYLYSRHQKWIASMGRYRNPSRQVSMEVLFRWSWATILLCLLIAGTLGVVLMHAAIIYCTASPQHMIVSARLAAFIDNYFGEEAIDPASLPELPRESKFFRRLAAPFMFRLPEIRY